MIDKLMTDMAEQSAMPTKDPYEMDDKPHPQGFSVNEKQLPAITNWEVGSKYTLTIEVIMKEERVKSDGERCAYFVISKIGGNKEKTGEVYKAENNDFILEEYFT
jgi:hypothetical protein